MENVIHAVTGDTEVKVGTLHTEVLSNASGRTHGDAEIVEMYWNRNESAIRETEKKYGAYLMKIAQNILADLEDSKESVNDTYLKAWNSMPSHRPEILSTYLGKIIRRLSIDTLRKRSRQKREGSQFEVSMSELEECIPAQVGGGSGSAPEQAAEANLLTGKINAWLDSLPAETANVFIGRYYFCDSVKAVAENYSMSESKVKSMLHRCRSGLKEYLLKEGFQV
jgi:RNA polymerase sigma-70 factor (ECF subfamily)